MQEIWIRTEYAGFQTDPIYHTLSDLTGNRVFEISDGMRVSTIKIRLSQRVCLVSMATG